MKNTYPFYSLVIQTRVFLEGVLIPSSPSSRLMGLVLDGHFVPLVSSELLCNYKDALLSPMLGLNQLFVRDFMDKFSSLSESVTATPLPADLRKFLGEDHLFYSISNSAGKVPLIKHDLHFFLGNQDFRIPVYTPAGFLEKFGF